MLDVYVGHKAKRLIEQRGLNEQLISIFLGASGGPKWFTLLGLDKYLFGEFFKDRKEPLSLVGTSAGAFRSACFCQKDPVAAINTLAKEYSESDFTNDDSPQAVTAKAESMLEHIFVGDGIQQVINNPVIKPHFIATKAKFIVSNENRLLQGLGLTSSYLLNKVSRKLLNMQYERVVFRPQDSILTIHDQSNITSHYVSLVEENVKPALVASGAIPIVMTGVKDIPGAPQGMYRDGGIIDYHFDIEFNKGGIILYPHFSSNPKAGWFDKNSTRSVSKQNYDRTMMLVPSERFVSKLPYGKIPDRNDFKTFDNETRLKYWRKVFAETERLAAEFHEMVEKQDLSKLKALPF